MEDEEPSQRLTMSLIETCAGGPRIMMGGADERASDLLKIEVLRLDWQRISSIDNLDTFTNLRELYLQHNRIKVIEELTTLVNLEFLALGSNRIRRVENLRHLRKLQVLDMSRNIIEDIDTQELPHALVLVNLAGNPCSVDPGYRERVISSLPSLMVLDEEEVARGPPTAGVEECKGPIEGKLLPLGGRNGAEDVAAVLYVTVLSDSGHNVLPLRFSATGNLEQIASRFCEDHDILGDKAKDQLVHEMREAIEGHKLNELPTRHHQLHRQPGSNEGCGEADPAGTDQRLHAILNLQRTRARVMQESTATFEQHKNHLISATRKLVEQKTTAAHDRSDALEEDIKKIVEDARSELQLRRCRVSAENKKFAADMRAKVDQVLAGRRRETESAVGKKATVSLSEKE